DGIRDFHVTGVQTCALPIWPKLKGIRAVSPCFTIPQPEQTSVVPAGLWPLLALSSKVTGLECVRDLPWNSLRPGLAFPPPVNRRSEEHTSELQSRENLVCRL